MAIHVWVAVDEGIPTLCRDHNGASLDGRTPLVLEYLNEGGANFIFAIKPATAPTRLPMSLRRKLLRLRKDRKAALGTLKQLESLRAVFAPLFSAKHLIQHDLVAIGHGLTQNINSALAVSVHPSMRLADRLPEHETHAVLVTDMRPMQPDEVGLHFKPKWLIQSPDAPASATRCRTCALRAWRATHGTKTATDAQDICPLNLISQDRQIRRLTALRLTDDPRLISWLVDESAQLLGKLKHWQRQFGQSASLAHHRTITTHEVQDLCKAMTLRDCTLYLLVNGSTDVVEARLGDLDLKHPEKLAKWRELEQTLVDGGWYTNTESVDHPTLDSLCCLSRR